MPNESPTLDRVFKALSSPIRRDVISRLGVGPCRMTELAEPFNIALPSFLQHMQVLEDAEMVTSEKSGRVRTYSLHVPALLAAEHWMDTHRRQWETRLDQLDQFLNTLEKPQP